MQKICKNFFTPNFFRFGSKSFFFILFSIFFSKLSLSNFFLIKFLFKISPKIFLSKKTKELNCRRSTVRSTPVRSPRIQHGPALAILVEKVGAPWLLYLRAEVHLFRKKVVHTKKREEIKVTYDEKKKVSLKTTSSNNFHYVNNSLNIFQYMSITLFTPSVLENMQLQVA